MRRSKLIPTTEPDKASPGKSKTIRQTNKKPPVDLSHHFSIAAKNRLASDVKQFYKYFQIPGIRNLASGLPHPSYFPYDTLEASVAVPGRFPSSDNQPTPQNASMDLSKSERLLIPKLSETPNIAERIDLETALQYGVAVGYPPLHSFIRQFVRKNLHPNVPYTGGPEVIMTCGSTDGFFKTIETFTNVWSEDRNWIRERQGVLCEEFAYMTAIQTAKPRGVNIVPVTIDAEGMKVDGKGGLADVLDNWDFRRGRRPHLMYTVTLGQNPCGTVLPVSRRREIYSLCQKYDIIIIEDDPYWHLQYPSAMNGCEKERGGHQLAAHQNSSGFEFLDSLVPSYLSIDIDGRVVRLDTFSKTIAPGCRLGWLTAQPKVVERILRLTEYSTQQPSGFSQSMVAKLIMGDQGERYGEKLKGDSGWKVDGWVRWLEGLRGDYQRRMQTMCGILEDGKFITVEESQAVEEWEIVHKVQMFDFNWPGAGMFVWVKICFETHPLWSKVSPEILSKALWKHLLKEPYLCLVGPGQLFSPTDEIKKEKGWRYMRLCFAAIDEKDVPRSSHGFVEGFRSFWQIKDAGEIDGDDEISF